MQRIVVVILGCFALLGVMGMVAAFMCLGDPIAATWFLWSRIGLVGAIVSGAIYMGCWGMDTVKKPDDDVEL